MAAITESLPLDQIAAQADAVRPGRALATAILWVFVGFGWSIGAAGRAIVMAGVSVRYGILRGYGRTDAQIEARATAKAALKQPSAPPSRG